MTVSTRTCLIPDLDDELTDALLRLEDTLLGLTDRRPLDAVQRLWDTIAPTQSRRGRLVRPALFAPDGRYEHRPLRVVLIDPADPSVLVMAATDPDHDLDGLGVLARRMVALLSLAWTPDMTVLAERIASAGDADVVLDSAGEEAYRRTADRLNATWSGGSPLDRFLY